MPIDPVKLEKAGVDVAGATTDVFLNRFSKAHFSSNAPIYKGVVEISDFKVRLTVGYEVKNPIEFDLSPIRSATFKKLWLSHLRQKGAQQLTLRDVVDTPPNLRIRTDKIKFTFTVYKENDPNQEDFHIVFEWDLAARCAVLLVPAEDNGKAVRLEPIDVRFTKPSSKLLRDIARAVNRIANKRGGVREVAHTVFGDPRAKEWCLDLEKLILFLINQVLALQLANFIREWNLPRAIEIFRGVSIFPFYLDVADNQLVVGGQVEADSALLSDLSAQAHSLIQEFGSRMETELEALDDKQLRKWTAVRSGTMKWLDGVRNEAERDAGRFARRGKSAKRSRVAENLLLASNGDIVSAIAKKVFNAHEGWSGGIKIDRIVKAEAGWYLHVTDGDGGIVPRGIWVSCKINVGGYARVCHFDIDPKNFGEWKCYGLCIDLKPEPNGEWKMTGYLESTGDAMYVRVLLNTNKIDVEFCNGVPEWARPVLEWITEQFGKALLAVLRTVLALIRFKLLTYPKHFPGTALEWKPNVASTPSNSGPYLVIAADPKFK